MSQPPARLDASLLSEWFKGGGTRGGHEGLDLLENNWDVSSFPPVEQLRLYADVARRSIRGRGVAPADLTDSQVRRLVMINRALREMGEVEEPTQRLLWN